LEEISDLAKETVARIFIVELQQTKHKNEYILMNIKRHERIWHWMNLHSCSPGCRKNMKLKSGNYLKNVHFRYKRNL